MHCRLVEQNVWNHMKNLLLMSMNVWTGKNILFADKKFMILMELKCCSPHEQSIFIVYFKTCWQKKMFPFRD